MDTLVPSSTTYFCSQPCWPRLPFLHEQIKSAVSSLDKTYSTRLSMAIKNWFCYLGCFIHPSKRTCPLASLTCSAGEFAFSRHRASEKWVAYSAGRPQVAGRHGEHLGWHRVWHSVVTQTGIKTLTGSLKDGQMLGNLTITKFYWCCYYFWSLHHLYAIKLFIISRIHKSKNPNDNQNKTNMIQPCEGE